MRARDREAVCKLLQAERRVNGAEVQSSEGASAAQASSGTWKWPRAPGAWTGQAREFLELRWC